jgi:two-component system, cell cycle sensor histidine kinase and response regulator CckA
MKTRTPASVSISGYIKELPPIPVSTGMYEVFDRFRNNKEATFFPVVDDRGFPLGVVREYDLKDFTYGMFGRELIKREPLKRFITPCLTVAVDTPVEDILRLAPSNENPDGVILLDNGKYLGIVLNAALLFLFEENRKQTRVRLLQAQKMESIGTLAGGIAHDFNNILMPIIGYAELLKHFITKKDSPELNFIDQIITAGTRARDLVAQILKFSRQSSEEKTCIHLATVVSEVLDLLRSSLPTTIEIRQRNGASRDTICASATEIHQVLMNLCANSAHAMRETGGVLEVGLADHYGPPLGWSDDSDASLGDCLRLTVRDTGHGIDPALLGRIFDPFFTTKKQGEGTGMGLAVVHGIVKGCGGAISVESSPGAGAAFHVYFKKTAPAQIEADASVDPDAAIPDGGISILFVDDEPMITSMAEEMFSILGISASCMTDSREAYDIFAANPGTFDAVVTDQTMPGLTGIELAKKLIGLRPGLPVVLCTGYSETVSAEIAKSMGVAEYLPKPVDFEKLKRILIALVDKARANQSAAPA